jgi:hypothetical protein
MSKQTKTSRGATDQQLVVGLQKHLPKGASFTVEGKKYTTKQIVSFVQARLDATQAASAAKDAWRNAVKAEGDTVAGTQHVLDIVRQTLLMTLDPAQVPLSDFGIAPRKTAGTLKAEELVIRVEKARATRAARHTLGKRQKAKVKGEVHVTPPANEANGLSPAAPPHAS